MSEWREMGWDGMEGTRNLEFRNVFDADEHSCDDPLMTRISSLKMQLLTEIYSIEPESTGLAV